MHKRLVAGLSRFVTCLQSNFIGINFHGLFFKLGRLWAFQLSLCFLLGAYWLAGSRQPDGSRESYHFRGNWNLGLGRLLALAASHSPRLCFYGRPNHRSSISPWGQLNIEIWVTLGGRTGSVFSLTTPPWETSYSRCFLGIGAEVSFFCNFFLLCLGVGLSSRAEVSIPDLSWGVLYLKPAFTLVITAT